MMVKVTKALMAIWIITLGLSAAAWADGAPPPKSLEPPTVRECSDRGNCSVKKCPLIEGDFTVIYIGPSTDNPKHFQVQVDLKRDGQTETYWIDKPISADSKTICDYKNLPMDELIHKYRLIPQDLKVQKMFGLEGIPVITELKITPDQFCQATISGKLKIRVLHPKYH